jgi:hypothetical protein
MKCCPCCNFVSSISTNDFKQIIMKKLLVVIFILASLTGFSQEKKVSIPAKQTVEFDYPDCDVCKANLQGFGNNGISVAVVSKESGEIVRSFGLGKYGNVDVMIEAENKLVLKNSSKKEATVKIEINKENQSVFEKKERYISFTLRNETAKSIPLIIPNVMNPNLSPFSNSGVDLKIGQKIYFRKKGKKILFLEVDESIKDGDIIKVGALLKERSK